MSIENGQRTRPRERAGRPLANNKTAFCREAPGRMLKFGQFQLAHMYYSIFPVKIEVISYETKIPSEKLPLILFHIFKHVPPAGQLVAGIHQSFLPGALPGYHF